MIEKRTGFGNLKHDRKPILMMRTAVPDQIKTGRPCFSRTATDRKGTPAGQPLLERRVN
ncbi:hypothetical protein [Chryseobacterium sp. BLS98]|uniref:hypothetical protein n=1 Tax=Chryseobacterium sp. BLS98 TaxID=885586 RepID=UPI000A822996|nr:hypothetical protein [Chryseobacterium sp. BLS98]